MDFWFVALQRVLPKRLISDVVGWLTRREGGWLTQLAIRTFIRAYNVDMRDARAPDPSAYPTFNAFFTRALADDARPLPADPATVACAADGRISEQGAITSGRLLQAKGVSYSLTDLFGGDAALAARFSGGDFQTIYLAPYNYHRVHMPLTGTAERLRYMPGALFSVNARTARGLPGLFCTNERVAVVFNTSAGSFALVMVGALNVGSIDLVVPATPSFSNRPAATFTAGTTHALAGPTLARGAEFGRFNMGSTIIMLASPGLLEWDDALAAGSVVKMGMAVGRLCTPPQDGG